MSIDGKEGLIHCFGPEWNLNVLTDGWARIGVSHNVG